MLNIDSVRAHTHAHGCSLFLFCSIFEPIYSPVCRIIVCLLYHDWLQVKRKPSDRSNSHGSVNYLS
jgi:hypothetical protein